MKFQCLFRHVPSWFVFLMCAPVSCLASNKWLFTLLRCYVLSSSRSLAFWAFHFFLIFVFSYNRPSLLRHTLGSFLFFFFRFNLWVFSYILNLPKNYPLRFLSLAPSPVRLRITLQLPRCWTPPCVNRKLTVVRRSLALDEILYSWFYPVVHAGKKKSYPWRLSNHVHYPNSDPLKKCCIGTFLSFFSCSCSTLSWTFSSWIVVLANGSMQQKRHPTILAALTALLLSHLQLRLLPEKKRKSAYEGTSCSELTFNGCSESSLFNWLIKVALDYILCGKRDV